MIDYILAPVVEAHHDRFAVAFSIKGVASGLELFAELNVVVDLTIERQGVAVGLAFRAPLQRLVGVGDVNDGQAVEAKDNAVIAPRPAVIRAAVVHARQRLFDGRNILGSRTIGRNKTKQSTHGC